MQSLDGKNIITEKYLSKNWTFKTSQIKNVGILRRTKINWRENKGLKVLRQVM